MEGAPSKKSSKIPTPESESSKRIPDLLNFSAKLEKEESKAEPPKPSPEQEEKKKRLAGAPKKDLLQRGTSKIDEMPSLSLSLGGR